MANSVATRTSWTPGQSGNPNGRPKKGDTVADRIAKAFRGRKVPFRVLAEVCQGTVTISRKDPETGERKYIYLTPTVADMIHAAEVVAAYEHGKPVQAVLVAEATPAQRSLEAAVEMMRLANSDVVEGEIVAALPSGEAAQPSAASEPSHTPPTANAPVSGDGSANLDTPRLKAGEAQGNAP